MYNQPNNNKSNTTKVHHNNKLPYLLERPVREYTTIEMRNTNAMFMILYKKALTFDNLSNF